MNPHADDRQKRPMPSPHGAAANASPLIEPSSVWLALPIPAFLTQMHEGQEVILDANPEAEEFTAIAAHALRDTPLFSRLSFDPPIEDALVRVRSTRAALLLDEVTVATAQRARVAALMHIAPMNDPADTLLVLITPREFAGRMGQTAAAKAAAKSAVGLAAMLAHEIKNPLAGIAGAAQLLSMELPSAERELTELIVAETRRIVALLEQVEQFGDQRPPARRPVNIHDVLERSRRSAELGFAKHMRIVDDYDPSLPPVWADPDQLLQVFLNLIKNAAEASPKGGTIKLRSFYEPGLLRRARGAERLPLPIQVEVIDDGPGVPADLRDSIFDPFVSGKPGGTGLGLALVSKIIAAHEGWITLESQPGRTVFRLSLPAAPRTPSQKE